MRILISFLFLFSSCKFSFEKDDLKTYNIYKGSEILEFRSDTNLIDKILILKKPIKYFGWNENNIYYTPPYAIISYENIGDLDDFTSRKSLYGKGSDLLVVIGKSPNEPPTEQLSFRGFSAKINREKQLFKLNYDTIYRIPSETFKDSSDIYCIYWSDSQGIIGYEQGHRHWKLTGINVP